MHVYASVSDAFEYCFKSKTFSFIHLEEHPLSETFFPSDVYTFFYSDSATFELLIHNHAYSVEADTILIIKPFEFTRALPCNVKSITGFLLFVHPDFLSKLLTYYDNWKRCFLSEERDFIHVRIPHHTTVTAFEHLFIQLHSPKEFGKELYTHHACLEFLLSLCQSFDASAFPELIPLNYHVQHYVSGLSFEEILVFIDVHFTQEYKLKYFAKKLFISDSYLCRTFKTYTGITLNHYINARRISLSQNYLVKGYNISESLPQCGFHEYSTFLKAFKKHAGCTPTEFLLRNRLL